MILTHESVLWRERCIVVRSIEVETIEMHWPRRFPHGPAHDDWIVELALWAVVGLIVALNVVMMWRIATATV